jgi:hypothetical protein
MSSTIDSNTTIFDSNVEVISTQAEFGASTITLVDLPPVPTHLTYAQADPNAATPTDPTTAPLPRTPTPETAHTPARPHLTIAPDSDTEEGEIVSRVHHHNYPLSPQSSLNIMQGHPELNASTLRTIAIGLANTAIGRTFQHLEAKTEIEQLRKELTDLHAEMSRQPDAECPEGFEENHGHLPDFTIPNADNIMRQARYIKLGNGPIPFALGTLGQEGDPIFQYDLFAAPSYIRDSPTEPLPMWLVDAISGKSSSYHQAMDLAHSTDDWGLAAKVTRYHEADTHILNIAAKIHALDCELQISKASAWQSRGRLEGARALYRLRALQALDTRRPTRANTHAGGLHFARGRATFLDGE